MTTTDQQTLTAAQAQRLLDHVARSLEKFDDATAERVLDEFVERLRQLDDLALVRAKIAQADDAALEQLGGVEGATALIFLVERIAMGDEPAN
jgi:hypothetical protein